MKITITETFDLTPSQIRLIKVLAKGGRYLHEKTIKTAEKTPGIEDDGNGKYYLYDLGWKIFYSIRNKSK